MVEGVSCTFKGNKLIYRGGKNARVREVEYPIKFNTRKSPKHLDITIPEWEAAGVKLLGIYEVKGDELKLCLSLGRAEKERPKKFNTTQGLSVEMGLILLKRQKP